MARFNGLGLRAIKKVPVKTLEISYIVVVGDDDDVVVRKSGQVIIAARRRLATTPRDVDIYHGCEMQLICLSGQNWKPCLVNTIWK